MNICEFCNKQFSSVSSLNYHKKTNKTCISIRENKISTNDNLQLYKCEFCNSSFNMKSSLSRHIKICKKSEEIDDLKEENKFLKQQIEELNKKILLSNETKDKKLREQEKKHTSQLESYRENVFKLQLELKDRDGKIELLKESLNRYYKLDEKREKEFKQESRVQQERYIVTNVINNNNSRQINNGLDFSQIRFDKHVEQNFTFQMYENYKEGAKQLIITFLYYEDNLTAVVCDDSRDKIRIKDSYGNNKVLTLDTLVSLCQNSNILLDKLKEFGAKYFERPENPFFPLQDEVTDRAQMFKKESLRAVYKKIKQYITQQNEDRTYICENEQKMLTDDSKEPDIQSRNNNIDSFEQPFTNTSISRPQRRDILFSPEIDEKAREYRMKHNNENFSEINIDTLPEVT